MPKTTAPTPDQPGRWVVSKFGPPSVLEWKVFDPLPEPSNDEILISIIATGISGADNIQRVGGYPDPRCEKPGFSPGYDFVGEVQALGPDVPSSRGFSKGDRVTSMCTLGAYATHILLPAGEVTKLQKSDDPIAFCAIPLNYMTAYGMLKRAGVDLSKGSSILIGSASGGVGTAMAQLVHAFDLDLKMYGTCSSSKFDFVQSLGITPIDRKAEDIPARVRELTGGKMVDVAYDAVGSQKSLKDSLASIKEDGKVIGIGAMSKISSDGSGMVDSDFDPFKFITEHPSMSFFGVTFSYYDSRKDVFLEDLESVFQAVRDGKLDPYIGKLFPLHDAVKANEMLASGVGVMGKMEFVVDAELAKARGVA
ncbi:MAG: hypothetical protein M1816_004533 [Peltula sp. TS41687]|nr:MAG: hypothetical protein M1816_004533 [Peltula sp. TS41687]